MDLQDITLKQLTAISQVRLRPSVYLGDTPRITAFREITDNAIDVFIKTHQKDCRLWINIDTKKSEITVKDNAGGLPVNEKGIPEIETTYSPFSSSNYDNDETASWSSGTNGVGGAAARCVSQTFQVTTQRGKSWRLDFKDGEKVGLFDGHGSFKETTQPVKGEKLDVDGTEVRWRFDDQILRAYPEFDPQEARDVCYTYAMLLGQRLTVNFTVDSQTEVMNFSTGLLGHIERQSETWKVAPLCFDGKFKMRRFRNVLSGGAKEFMDEVGYTVAFGLSETHENVVTDSYVNIVQTSLGGTHVKALETALEESVKSICNRRNVDFLKKGEAPPSYRDISLGMICAIRLQINNPAMLQNKQSLQEKKIGVELAQVLIKELTKTLDANPTVRDSLVKNAVENARSRELAALKREQKRKKVAGGDVSLTMPDKLSDCKEHGQDSELFITEGDSAKGAVVAARDAKFQAVFPIRGKILNTFGKTTPQALKNEEISAITQILGAGIGKTFDPEKCRYERVLFATDADPDGGDIQNLLLCLFACMYPGMVEAGRVFLCVPPLFTLRTKDKEYQVKDQDELEKVCAKLDKKNTKYSILRNKGLGEMDINATRASLTDPATRILYQVSIEDIHEAAQFHKELELWFSANAANRQEVITADAYLYDRKELQE